MLMHKQFEHTLQKHKEKAIKIALYKRIYKRVWQHFLSVPGAIYPIVPVIASELL